MKGYIDGYDFWNMDAQKYWAPPSSWAKEKKVDRARERIFSGEWYGARKMDGAFYQFIKDEDGNMALLSRSRGVGGDFAEKIEWVPQLKEFFESLPNGTCLIGEIYFPNNEGSNKITSIMGCLKEKAIARQEKGGWLHYYVFDVLAFDGKSCLDKTMIERIELVKKISKLHSFEYNEFAKYYSGKELWSMLQAILANGGEGIVITRGGAKYQPGKRPSKDCQKVKKELQDTIDCFFTGRATAPSVEYTGKEIETWEYWKNMRTNEKLRGNYFEAYQKGEPLLPITKPYYNNWAGSLEIGVFKDGKIKSIGYLSGLTEEIKANVKKYSMQPIEVSAMEITEDGLLRHGKFLGFRKDIALEDCTFEKIFG